MGLFGLSIIKSKNKLNSGCRYKEQSDTICNYLSDIVKSQNHTIFTEFREHAKIITKHNEKSLAILEDLRIASAKKETRLNDLENYIKPKNMIFFDKIIELKWVFIAWFGINTLLSFTTLLIVVWHIFKK
jgi:hypothetical protein